MSIRHLPWHMHVQGADGASQVQVTAFQSVRKEAPGSAMSRGGSAEVVDSPMAKALAASKAGARPLPAPEVTSLLCYAKGWEKIELYILDNAEDV